MRFLENLLKLVFGAPRKRTPQIAPPSDQASAQLESEQDAKLAADIDKLKSDHLDLREKLLSLREGELLTLSHEVRELGARFKLALIVGGIVVTLLGALGFKQFLDLNDRVNKTMQKKIDDSLGYYDQVSKAMLSANNGGCASAVSLLADLAEKRPEDEVVFGYLTNCFIENGEYVRGSDYVAKLKEKGIFPKKLSSLISLNNVGFLFFIRSLTEPSFEREARELLKKADQVGVSTDSPDVRLPLSNLVLLELSVGKIAEATAYGRRAMDFYRQFPSVEKVTVDTDKDWFRNAEITRPTFRHDLAEVLPVALPASAAASGTKP